MENPTMKTNSSVPPDRISMEQELLSACAIHIPESMDDDSVSKIYTLYTQAHAASIIAEENGILERKLQDVEYDLNRVLSVVTPEYGFNLEPGDSKVSAVLKRITNQEEVGDVVMLASQEDLEYARNCIEQGKRATFDVVNGEPTIEGDPSWPIFVGYPHVTLPWPSIYLFDDAATHCKVFLRMDIDR